MPVAPASVTTVRAAYTDAARRDKKRSRQTDSPRQPRVATAASPYAPTQYSPKYAEPAGRKVREVQRPTRSVGVLRESSRVVIEPLVDVEAEPRRSPDRSSKLARMSKYAATAAALAGAVLVLLLLLQQPHAAEARPPSGTLSRPKRVSDQRLAELETLIALAKMRGKLVTVPIGFGKVDPMKIGRKRRSSTESNLQELRRILRSVVEDVAELSPKERSRYARLLFASSRWNEDELEEASDNRGLEVAPSY